MKQTFLNGFIERLNTYQLVYKIPFADFYNDWFVDCGKLLENEIVENILLAPQEKTQYLKYLTKRIEKDIVFQKDSNFLERWIQKYDLSNFEFPFIENSEVKIILSTSIEQPDLSYDMKKICSNMQQDFYCQAALIEKNNILKFIEGLAAKETIDSNKNETAKDENKGWFKVGLFFANGEAQKLYKKYKSEKGHFKKITLELGFKESDRPYFSETINNSTKNPKNIFKSSKKMKIIIDHCEKNNIPINDDFMSVFNTLQTK